MRNKGRACRQAGFSLITAVLIISVLLLLGAGLAKLAFNTMASTNLNKGRIESFYLAEGAIELGKTQVKNNPNWHTDVASAGNIAAWLKNNAVGQKMAAGPIRSLKAVKIKNSAAVYGVGYSGKSCAIIKFENGVFEEL